RGLGAGTWARGGERAAAADLELDDRCADRARVGELDARVALDRARVAEVAVVDRERPDAAEREELAARVHPAELRVAQVAVAVGDHERSAAARRAGVVHDPR